jgi:alpha-galactosidase
MTAGSRAATTTPPRWATGSIDRNKYPDGLTPLIDHVQGLGMRFGIWFEPEMVNPTAIWPRAPRLDSRGPEGQPSRPQQHVLNMANPRCGRLLFDQIAAILSEHAIDYIKWDHNRILTACPPARRAGSYRCSTG